MTETISTEDHVATGTADYDLVSVVVEYEDRPDQCTIYPVDSNELERMSNWISADRECFTDLYAMR